MISMKLVRNESTPALLFAVLFSLRGQLDAHYVRMNLEFTYLGYKKEFWWWECYSLMRKFVISFTMVYYKKDYSMQILLSLASTDIFLVTLVAKQPYSSNLQNWFDIGQLLTIAITLQCSLLFGADGAGPRGTRTCAILTSGSARSRTDVLARAPKEDQPAAEDTGIPDFWERRESRPPSVGEVPYLPSFHFGLDQEDFWERESTADMRTSEIRSRLTSSNSLIVNDGLVYQDQAEGTVAVPNDQSKASRFQPARYLKALALRAYNAFASRDDSMTGSSSLVRSDHGEGRLAARSDFCKGDVPPASGVTTINPMSTVAGASDWTAAETSQPSTPAISQEPSGLVTEMATISRQEMPGESTPSREAWRTLRAQSAAPEPLTELTKRRSSRVEVLKHEVLKNSVDHGAMLEQGNMQWGLQGLDQSLLTEELGPTAPVEMEGEGLKSSVLLEEPGPAVPIKLEGEGLESQSLSTEDPGPAVPSELKEEELENSLPEEPSPPALESGLVEEKLDTSVSSESPNSLLLGEMEAPSAALHPSPVNVNQSSEAKRRAEYLASRGGVKEVRVSEGDLEHSLGSFEEMK
eukprot:gene8525-10123_t